MDCKICQCARDDGWIAKRQTLVWKAAPKDEYDKGEPFAMFLLAPDGYRYLGFGDAHFRSRATIHSPTTLTPNTFCSA